MKQSTKNKSQIYIIKFVILFFLALTLSNCQVEEDIDKKESGIQTVDINEALSFLKFNLVNSSSKTGKKSFLLPDLNAISQEKIINSDQLLTVIPLSTNNSEEYSRILMVRLRDTLKTVVFSMYSDKDLLTEYFSGKIMVRNLNGDFVSGFRVKNGTIISQFQKTAKSITKKGENELNEVLVENDYRRPNDSTPFMHLYGDSGHMGDDYGSYSWDSGSGGGGGGDGSSSSEDIPPSCESFNFTSKSGTNWQESAVVNVHFNIVVVSPNGYKFSQIIEFPKAILFGTPTNLLIGNTVIDSGLAATLSAKAIKVSMDETVNLYGNKSVSELTVRLYFEERLKYNYPLFIPGGRVNFAPTNLSVNPTNYKTNMFGTGNCN